jgi:hypothetical protein
MPAEAGYDAIIVTLSARILGFMVQWLEHEQEHSLCRPNQEHGAAGLLQKTA